MMVCDMLKQLFSHRRWRVKCTPSIYVCPLIGLCSVHPMSALMVWLAAATMLLIRSTRWRASYAPGCKSSVHKQAPEVESAPSEEDAALTPHEPVLRKGAFWQSKTFTTSSPVWPTPAESCFAGPWECDRLYTSLKEEHATCRNTTRLVQQQCTVSPAAWRWRRRTALAVIRRVPVTPAQKMVWSEAATRESLCGIAITL